MDFQKQLGIKILDAYRKSIFGKVSKFEIDIIVFGAFVMEAFENNATLCNNDGINWFRLESEHIRQLSIKLKITENKVSSLIENCALFEMYDDKNGNLIVDEIKRLILKTRQNSRDIAAGMIRIHIPNKLTRTAIEGFLAKSGGIPDTSFSQKILTIRLIDLINAFQCREVDSSYLLEVASNANGNRKSKEIKDFISKANQKSGIEKLQLLSAAILKSFIGNVGEHISDEMFKHIEKKL